MMNFIDLSMYETVKSTSLKYPKNIAIDYQGKKIKYSSFIRKIDRMADILHYEFGIKENDVVLVAQPNIPATLILIYAINKIGGVVNLVHPYIPYNQIRNIINNTNTKIAFLFEQRVAKEVDKYRHIADRIVVTRIEDDLPIFKKVIYHTFYNSAIRKKLGPYRNGFSGFKYLVDYKTNRKGSPTIINKEKTLSVLLHSGSTTGEPKTIRLSDSNFNFIASQTDYFVGQPLEKLKAKGMLSILPSFHGFGFCMSMHLPLTYGLTCVLIPKFSAKKIAEALRRTPIGLICGVPTMYQTLLNSKEFCNSKYLKRLYIAWSGGDHLSEELNLRFNELMQQKGSKCRLFEGYGLTETVAANIINNHENNKLGSIGKPIKGVDVKIVDEEGNEVSNGETGEITIKGPSNMLGYYKNDKDTNEYIKGGYIYTGDIGMKDEDGYIYFKSRKKRVIKVSGVGVFPSEIENLVNHISGVKESCAIQIPHPKHQHAVKLLVVAEYFDEQGMKEIIFETCKRYLLKWATPKEIELVDELPKTLLGKIDYKTLQELENERRGIK